jgi:polar amino acid transport system substrate-binding protein
MISRDQLMSRILFKFLQMRAEYGAGLCALTLFLATAFASSPAPAAEPLRVVVAGSAPFVVDDSGKPGGLSVEVFELVAARAELPYTLTATRSVEGALAAVHAGEMDVAIGPISITAARTASVAFSQPYYRARTGIAAHEVGIGVWSRIAPFLSTAFAVGVGFLLAILVLVGGIVWALERRANPGQFPEAPLPGIGAGVWLALVTMTTVGYGDKAPVTVAGRVVVGIWMIIAMITASSLTASIATALTLSQLDPAEIEGLEDLAGRPVAHLAGTISGDVVQEAGGRPVPVGAIGDALAQVLQGGADAAVGDLPVLQYELRQKPGLPITLVPIDDRVQHYGFAVRHDDPVHRWIDVALLALLEDGRVTVVERRWLTN